MKIIWLAGNGKLAKEIKNTASDFGFKIINLDLIDANHVSEKPEYIVFCGSERNIEKSIKLSYEYKIPILILSTGIDLSNFKNTKYVYLPNTASSVNSFFVVVRDFYKSNKIDSVKIVESHQASKKDVSGTAMKLCDELGLSYKNIKSIRNKEHQLLLGIPKKYLDGHAYHKISFASESLKISFEVLVLGRRPYAEGLFQLILGGGIL